MVMTMHDKLGYDNSTLCHICNEELGKDKVRDHCHLSGKFRDAAPLSLEPKIQGSKVFPSCISQFIWLWESPIY